MRGRRGMSVIRPKRDLLVEDAPKQPHQAATPLARKTSFHRHRHCPLHQANSTFPVCSAPTPHPNPSSQPYTPQTSSPSPSPPPSSTNLSAQPSPLETYLYKHASSLIARRNQHATHVQSSYAPPAPTPGPLTIPHVCTQQPAKHTAPPATATPSAQPPV